MRPNAAADLLVAAAAAVNRADALQRAEASESDVSPQSWQAPSRKKKEKDAERRLKKDRLGDLAVRPDEVQSQGQKQELRGERNAKADEAASAQEPRRVKRKVQQSTSWDPGLAIGYACCSDSWQLLP